MDKGKFIVIEGADGTGKGTQAGLFVQRLKEEGVDVTLFDFPQYEATFFGGMVGKYLNGDFGALDEVNPYFASLPFAGDRWQAGTKIREVLNKGGVILSNRYFFSNVAHQAAKLPAEERDEFIDFLEELEYEVYGIPREDLNVVLHIPPDQSMKLIEQKKKRAYLKGKAKDIQEEDVEYQISVAGIYRDLPNRYPHIVEIDCVRGGKLMSIEKIQETIWSEVKPHLKEILAEGRVTGERQR